MYPRDAERKGRRTNQARACGFKIHGAPRPYFVFFCLCCGAVPWSDAFTYPIELFALSRSLLPVASQQLLAARLSCISGGISLNRGRTDRQHISASPLAFMTARALFLSKKLPKSTTLSVHCACISRHVKPTEKSFRSLLDFDSECCSTAILLHDRWFPSLVQIVLVHIIRYSTPCSFSNRSQMLLRTFLWCASRG